MLFEKDFSDDRYEEIYSFLKHHKNRYTGFVVEQICNTGGQFIECPLFLFSEQNVVSFFWYQYTGELTITVYGRDEFNKYTDGNLFRDPRWKNNDFVYINSPYAEEIHAPIRSIKLRHRRWSGKRILSAIEVQFEEKALRISLDEIVPDMMNSVIVPLDGE